MHRISVFALITGVAFCTPFQSVFALPPPDLILSISQTILNVAGLLVATLIVALGSVRTYFYSWTQTKLGTFFLYTAMLIIICIIGFLIWGYQNNKAIEKWKVSVDSDLRAIWDEFEPIYSAENEAVAQNTMYTPAKEVTWTEFLRDLKQNGEEEYIVIDIRDRYPYEIGHIENSRHMRFADLLLGDWEQIEAYKDTPVFIVCYLGTTGALTAQFLEKKGFTKLYQPKDGITGAVALDPNTPFIGDTLIPLDRRGVDYVSFEEASVMVDGGAKVIDLRFPTMYDTSPGFTVEYQFLREKATQDEIDIYVAALPKDTKYLLLCHGDASCYSARMLLHDLDVTGRTVLSTYNTAEPEGFLQSTTLWQ